MRKTEEKIYCNCCGTFICGETEREKYSFLSIRKEWGYFSNGKDGKICSVDICEACCEKLAASFVIPPAEDEVTEFL